RHRRQSPRNRHRARPVPALSSPGQRDHRCPRPPECASAGPPPRSVRPRLSGTIAAVGGPKWDFFLGGPPGGPWVGQGKISFCPWFVAEETTLPLEQDLSPAARLLSLLDHLDLGVAHVATQMPGDIADLAAGFASRLGGVVLCVPNRLDPEPFER